MNDISASDTVSSLCWDSSSLYLASAGGEDRHVRVWHNHPGQRQLIQEMKAKLPKATSDALKVFATPGSLHDIAVASQTSHICSRVRRGRGSSSLAPPPLRENTAAA